MRCSNNVKQICLALHNYHDDFHSFPPAISYDAAGNPMHSWRVLLLPYLEESELYEKYSMDEPWDGANNAKLLDEMPSVYRCPYQSKADYSTGYCVVVGERTCFPPHASRSLRDIVDGPSGIIAIVEYSPRIDWMAPVDPTLEEFKQDITTRGPDHPPPHAHSDLVGYYYPSGSNFGFADGSVQYASGDSKPAIWDKLLQIDDGSLTDQGLDELLNRDQQFASRARPEGYLAIGIFSMLTLLPAFWLRHRQRL